MDPGVSARIARMPAQRSNQRALTSIWPLLAMWAGFVLATVAGGSLIIKMFGWDAVDYADLSASTDTVVENLLVPLLLPMAVVIILISALRWWRPVLVDDRSVPRWMISFPIVIMVASLAATDWDRLSDVGGSYFLALAAATLLVGLNEELMARGVLLTGFRRLGSETSAWLWSTGLFALMHGANLFQGSPLRDVLHQIMSTFVLGTLLYLSRRATGSLLVPIIVHATWDFSLLSHGTSKAAIVPGSEAALQLLQAPLPMILFVIALVTHKSWMSGSLADDTSV